jgi:hypothetical protein
MRVRNRRGNAFSFPLEFLSGVRTTPGSRYSLSMYTLINCGSNECSAARDRISVKVRDRNNGEYREIYSVSGRSHDDRWYNSFFTFDVRSDAINVKKKTLNFFKLNKFFLS